MAPEPVYIVRPYGTVDDVVPFLATPNTHAPVEVVAEKNHLVYLREYLEHLKCSTLVAETEYVDGDFLEDYANYYVRCFEPYRRHCRRLHFFSTSFDQPAFTALLDRDIAARQRIRLFVDNALGNNRYRFVDHVEVPGLD